MTFKLKTGDVRITMSDSINTKNSGDVAVLPAEGWASGRREIQAVRYQDPVANVSQRSRDSGDQLRPGANGMEPEAGGEAAEHQLPEPVVQDPAAQHYSRRAGLVQQLISSSSSKRQGTDPG